ncbi:pilus assembly protein PilY [Verminephrobacter aporrectodeae subsp. tuberculatae]|uniref:pilus assembly protein n=1 Tax=Verminephrobacter aporrectodeae TaxID=1110389 RepID=UPI0022438006|nr:PilC/PilY family type IV pilus protein [Verminephrobacter aporrectodeae]MCW8166979.1 pilus assembly protein PilY [Verminephrobacter aporrectodeae subsp. tuberculatae]MCW8168284.1 pilus assembly protein PilY [Verminephrobacter aporrectodeae subsp. tuberculatae]
MPASTVRRDMPELHKRHPKSLMAWLAWAVVLPMSIAVSWLAIGSEAPPTIQKIALASAPLYATSTVDKPTMTLALSVEFPTVGAQYNILGSEDDDDDSYTTDKEYLGYYDAESCYTYIDDPQERPTASQSKADYKRFDKVGNADGRKCTDAFSGNFLNWASGSAIDMHRLALSGGDRYIDTKDLTILQRAVLPNGNRDCMWNNLDYFPSKQLKKDGGGVGTYFGAVPAIMITAANGNDIYVANMLNRIYFGRIRGGWCNDTSSYKLGAKTNTTRVNTVWNQVIQPRSVTQGPSWIECANEGGVCDFSGNREVMFGVANQWFSVYAHNGVDCTEDVMVKPGPGSANRRPGTLRKCFITQHNGPWGRRPVSPEPTNAMSLNSDGYFYARVRVCDVDSSGKLQDSRNYDFCEKYPNGNYKPTGVIQKYSEKMRFAAFGYLLDNNSRYGGVLRAPMKYVGSKTYDIRGYENSASGNNPNTEWNAQTGVFIENPDRNNNYQNSGIINYLNKFGRSGIVPGVYKVFDPVGELYYEALRYLQGLQPSPNAIKEPIDSTMADGFPYFKKWDDPYGNGRTNGSDYSCVKSNIVVIGDVGTHDSDRMPTVDIPNNIPDIREWRDIVRNFENKRETVNYFDGQGTRQRISNPNSANPNSPGGTTGLIVGAAYWARTHDIRGTDWTNKVDMQRPGLRVKTFTFDVNEAGRQNNDAQRRTRNQFFLAAKYGGFETDPANSAGKPYNTQGNPFKDQTGADNNKVWEKSNEPGEADTYYFFNTSKPSPARDVLSAFNDIFSRTSSSMHSVAGGGLSTGSKITQGTESYAAKFSTSNWSGDVIAKPITQDASHANALVLGPPRWSAAHQLDTMSSPADTRKIFVGQSRSSTSNPYPVATEFTWDKIDRALKEHLDKVKSSAAADGKAKDRLAYLRGERSKEGNPFRKRDSRLGDIVNSNVSYSGAPSKAFGGDGYVAFRKKYDARTPAVFAGANDGMLHAFNAKTGDELFAYIPSWLGRNLSALTVPDFVNNHQNYVDAPSVVAETQVANTGQDTDWKTVLVSGTGGGGSGVFALDVTEPDKFDASKVMWEFTRANDPDIGQVVGTPKVMKIKTGNATATASASYRWFAVVAGGVNNYVPDGDGKFSSTGKPALFLLALDKPGMEAWTLGTNYFKVSVPIDTAPNATNATGLANFSALYGTQGEMTDIYMGDLHGALWRLQFADKPVADWNMDKLSFFNKGTQDSPTAYPLYIARTDDATPQVQPIFAAPTPFAGPIVEGKGSFYVVFGTGKYMEPSDNGQTPTQTIYAIYDNGSTTADSTSGLSVITGRKRLQKGVVDATSKTVAVADFQWGRPRVDADGVSSPRAGWYFDLSSGERVDQAALNMGALSATIHTKIPPGAGAASTASCSAGSGGGNQYFLNIGKGAGSYVPSNLGLLGPPVLQSSDSDVTVTDSDSTGRRIRTTTLHRFTQMQGGIDTSAPSVKLTEVIGRLSWREIFNYQETKK